MMILINLLLFVALSAALQVSLTTSTISVSFVYNSSSVQFASIAPADNSVQFLSPRIVVATPLWSATLIQGNAPNQQRIAVNSSQVSRWSVALSQPSASSLVFTFTDASCCAFSVLVNSNASAIQLSASWKALRAGLSLFDFTFALPLGGDNSDALLTPRGFGQVLEHAFAAPAQPLYTYPSTEGTMQVFALLKQAAQSLYVATHDPVGAAKYFRFGYSLSRDLQCALWNRECAASWSVTTPATDLGAQWTMNFPLVLDVFKGSSWFDAGEIYRRWATQEALWNQGRVRRPSLFDKTDLCFNSGWSMYDVLNVTQGTSATVLQDALDARTLFPNASLLLHWYVWYDSVPNFDMGYPDAFDSPRPNFASTVATLRAKYKIETMPYINGRSYDITIASYAQHKDDMVQTLNDNGTLRVDAVNYGNNVPLASSCAALPWWNNATIPGVVESLAQLGVAAVYVDQIAAASPANCYSASHGHPVGGGESWVLGNRKLLRNSSKYAAICTENSAEPYIGAADAYLTVASFVSLPSVDARLVPLFQSVYSNVTTVGRIYDSVDFSNQDHACAKTAQTLVFGSVLGWFSWNGVLGVGANLSDARIAVQCINRFAQMRSQLRPFFNNGRMLRDVPVVNAKTLPIIVTLFGVYPAVQTAAWSLQDKTIAVILTNSVGKDLTAVVTLASAQYGLDPSQTHTAVLRYRDGSSRAMGSFTSNVRRSVSTTLLRSGFSDECGSNRGSVIDE
jgi:hypothetical protein